MFLRDELNETAKSEDRTETVLITNRSSIFSHKSAGFKAEKKPVSVCDVLHQGIPRFSLPLYFLNRPQCNAKFKIMLSYFQSIRNAKHRKTLRPRCKYCTCTRKIEIYDYSRKHFFEKIIGVASNSFFFLVFFVQSRSP